MPANGVSRLPAEVWLEIIPHIPYSPQDLTSLRLTCVTLNGLVKHHEHSLVTDIKAAQFRRDSTQLFPGLALKTYANLSTLHRRLETLEELHGQWLEIVNHGVELHWLKGRWESIHKAGLLLLYRLLDAGTYEAKVKLLEQLPATSLACLLFKLISSIKILRVFGPEPINATYCKQDAMVRSDVELAFEELLLQHGPQMFAVMLKAGRLAGVAEIDGGRSERAVRYVVVVPLPPMSLSANKRPVPFKQKSPAWSPANTPSRTVSPSLRLSYLRCAAFWRRRRRWGSR